MHTRITVDQRRHAQHLLRQQAVDHLPGENLIAEGQYWQLHREELQDRLQTRDFVPDDALSGDTRSMLLGGIAWADAELTLVAKRLEQQVRLKRSGRTLQQDVTRWEERFARAKQRDLVAAFTACGVDLERRGAHYIGRCPLHDDRTPSLVVTPEKARWRCFGCLQSGDLVDFVCQLHHTTAIDALFRIEHDALGPR